MKVAYVAGPYREPTTIGIVQNIRRAETVALKYWKLGYAVICPHMNTALLDGSFPDDVWLDGDFELIRRCDVLVAMDGWRKSQGATTEVKLALALGLEVIYEGNEAGK